VGPKDSSDVLGKRKISLPPVILTADRPALNPLTAKLTSKRCTLYIYSTNIGTEYFEHGIYSPFFSLQNAVCFTILTYLVPVLFTFYTQDVLKLKKKSGAKRLKVLNPTGRGGGESCLP